MPTAAEYREWAAANGYQLNPKGRIPIEVKSAYILAHDPDYDAPAGADEEGNVVEAQPIVDVVPEPPSPFSGEEVRPNFGKDTSQPKGLRGFGSKWSTKRGTTSKGTSASTRAKSRVKLERFGEHAWALFSKMADSRLPATARVLTLQAPVAGIVLEENIKRGGKLDKLLQPLARTEEKGTAIFAMIAPIVIVAAIERNPHLAPMLEVPLKLALLEMSAITGPAMQKARQREQDLVEQFEAANIDGLVQMIFAGMLVETPEAQDAA